MRIAKILRTVGLEADVTEPRVVIIKHDRDEQLDQNVAVQSYANIVEVVDADQAPSSSAYRDRADIVVHVDTNYEYEPTHVEDLVNAFRYTDAISVEKLVIEGDRPSNMLRHSYGEPRAVQALGAEFVGDVPTGIDPRPGYQIDHIGVRSRSEVIEIGQRESNRKPPILSVVVPIYNNGPHLLYKCMASLRRSSIFDQMEIVLVDDGSTDIATVHAIDQLERELDWVQVYRYKPGGSGSASRPRNTGLELASCDYVTYLDPDNGALNDACVKLLHTVIRAGVDFAVGDMTRWRGANSGVRYHNSHKDRLNMETHIGSGGAQALIDMQFMPISIQALVARTAWLRDTGITQPIGAVGQDSYFFQQMLYYADQFAILQLPVHTYYAQVENSVVNTVNAKFFDKYLPLERARSQWLTQVGLLEDYKQTRMETFFTGWYLRKLADVPAEQRHRAITTIIELGQIYGDHAWQTAEVQEFWALKDNEIEAQHTSGDN